jgi:hypothetical protein
VRVRWVSVGVVAVLLACACSGKPVANPESEPANHTAPTSADVANNCDSAQLTAPDIGVSNDTITVTVVADTGSPIKPGLFKGSVDGLNAWAAYVNDNGGLACRRVVVNTADSRLSPDEARNAVLEACRDSFALVATTAIFFQDMSALEQCVDGSGKTTGLPDLAVLQTEPSHQCSKLSYAVLPIPGSCPYRGSGDRTFTFGRTANDFYLNDVSRDLHGVQIIPRDLPSTIAVAVPVAAAADKLGINTDAELGMSALAIQSDYAGVVQAIKEHDATFVRNSLDYTGNVMMRKEAQAQGVSSVKVWDCSLQCYDSRFISEGGTAVEGHYVWLQFLPLEDVNANAQLQALFDYEEQQGHVPDSFGLMAWLAGELFAQAVNDVVAAHGPNAITRPNLLAAVRNIHDFTGGGIAPPTDIANKKLGTCVVGMQVQDGEFVRVDPPTPGKFDCNGNRTVTVTLDPIKAFSG